jgi:hypothetical protein
VRTDLSSCIHNGTVEAAADDLLPGRLAGAGVILRDRLESMSGVRLRPRESPFGLAPGAVEQPKASPFPRSGGAERLLREHPELTQSPDRYDRQAVLGRQLDRMADVVLRTGGRARDWAEGPRPSERAEMLRGSGSVTFIGDGVGGSLIGLTAAHSAGLEL